MADEPADELEVRAFELLEGLSESTSADLPPSYVTRLVHQLQVHQIELEMQNEELQRAWAAEEELATGRAEQFELAPIAYAVVAGDGSLVATNRQARLLLSGAEGAPVGRDLGSLIHRADRSRWREALHAALEGGNVERFEVVLAGVDGEDRDVIKVQVRLAPSTDGQTCRVVLIDQ